MRTSTPTPGPGTLPNIISAILSLFWPGLGQLVQGRLGKAILFFLLAAILWWLLLGWIIHLWAAIDAASFRDQAAVYYPGDRFGLRYQ
jgi:TM2 domain-containing membrane protein YozV